MIYDNFTAGAGGFSPPYGDVLRALRAGQTTTWGEQEPPTGHIAQPLPIAWFKRFVWTIHTYIYTYTYIYIYIHIYIYINCLNNISCSKVLKSNGFSKHVWQWLHVVTSLEWWLGFGETSPSTPKWSLEFQQLSGCGFYCNSARLYVWFSLYICTYIHHIT